MGGLENAFDQLNTVIVGRQGLKPHAVDADERSSLDDVDQLLRLLRLILMPDHAAREVEPVIAEDLLLDIGAFRVLAVRDYREARFARGHRRRGYHLLFLIRRG